MNRDFNIGDLSVFANDKDVTIEHESGFPYDHITFITYGKNGTAAGRGGDGGKSGFGGFPGKYIHIGLQQSANFKVYNNTGNLQTKH